MIYGLLVDVDNDESREGCIDSMDAGILMSGPMASLNLFEMPYAKDVIHLPVAVYQEVFELWNNTSP